MPSLDRHSRPRERGAVVIWFSFFVLVMMFFVALGVDGAKLAATRVQLQNAADAAALAGASAIDSLAGNGNIVQGVAVIRAQQTGFLNPAFIQGDEPVVVDAADVTFPEPNRCQVVVRRQDAVGTGMLTAVAHIVGRPTLDMTATATAILEPASSVCELVPMGAVPPNQDGFEVGCEYTYELKSGAHDNISGNFRLLSFPECNSGPCAGMGSTGANTMRCLVRYSYHCCLEIDQVIETQPGDQVGPFSQAIDGRFDRDTDQRDGICYQDYRGNGERIVTVPEISEIQQGRTDVTILGFKAFFLKSRVQGGGTHSRIFGEFLYNVVPGRSDGNSNGSTAYTIRLIQ